MHNFNPKRPIRTMWKRMIIKSKPLSKPTPKPNVTKAKANK